MNCPLCGTECEVKDTRRVAPQEVRRRRQCPSCHHRFATLETVDVRKPLRVWTPKEKKAPKVSTPKPKASTPKKAKREEVRSMVEEFEFSMDEREDLSLYVDIPREDF